MGGYGSTRWDAIRTRPTAEASLRVTLDPGLRQALKKVENALKSGRKAEGSTLMRWSSRYSGSSSVMLHVRTYKGAIGLFLHYSASGEEILERIEVAHTDQRIGGRRAWLCCPGCGSRCITLYCPTSASGRHTGRFRCRACHNVTYDSSNASDKRVSRFLAGTLDMPGGAIAGWSIGALGVAISAGRVLEQRRRRKLRRALQRDMGRKTARKHYAWLWK